ncbi:MAG TPA: glycosyltransferase family 4 protein [Candidatus Acidoferrales bacterium]|nr:glycosyltransferase family 4 protein [Candidatus Acidoferrales bacterium]
MRVLLVTEVAISRPGGVETHLRELARGLLTLGHDVDVMGPRDALPGVHWVDAPSAAHDVVHDHSTSLARGVALDRRYVRTLHFCTRAKMDVYVRRGRLRTLANPGNWHDVIEERAAAKRPGRVVAVSARVRDDFARWHRLDPARAHVIPNGAAFASARTPRGALRARWGIPLDAPVLLTIGRQDFVKGYDLLARAWRAASLPPHALWVTVGGARSSRHEGRLVTGPLPQPEVADWVHAADLGALPSYYEGCSLALLEMLAGDLPVLAANVGNAAEVIRSPAHGELLAHEPARWAEALTLRLRPRTAPRAALLDDSFRWERIAERIAAVYAGGA